MNDCSTVTETCTTENVMPKPWVDYESIITQLLNRAQYDLPMLIEHNCVRPHGIKTRALEYGERIQLLKKHLGFQTETQTINHLRGQSTPEDPAGLQYLAGYDLPTTTTYCRTPSEVRDYFTVGVKGSRQTGKTTGIQQLAERDDWVIVFDGVMAETFIERYGQLHPTKARPRVFERHGLLKRLNGDEGGQLLRTPPARIFIDEASIVAEDGTLSGLRKWVARHLPVTPWIIEVG